MVLEAGGEICFKCGGMLFPCLWCGETLGLVPAVRAGYPGAGKYRYAGGDVPVYRAKLFGAEIFCF